MKFVSGPPSSLEQIPADARPVVLFDRSASPDLASAGASAALTIRREALLPATRAWDLLSIALSVVVADSAARRNTSPDGWTRELDLDIALADPEPWEPHASLLASALAFLTTDRWQFSFRGGGAVPAPPKKPRRRAADAVALLSGGLDSLIGAIDLTAHGKKLFAVSQTVRGDAAKQDRYASRIEGVIDHLQVNHNASIRRGAKETSQRSRSMIFLAFGVLAATTTERYAQGETVPLYISENGFIAINPPLTNARLGSLSTRTAHPEFLGRMQDLLDALHLRVRIENPYATRTKGEMLRDCADQGLLTEEAVGSTSCGRFQRFKYTHCGRCVPCQIRRAAFLAAGMDDTTEYVYENLGQIGEDHAAFDDVRSVAMARLTAAEDGVDRWIGSSVSSSYITNRQELRAMLQRGLSELDQLHTRYGVV